jgi:hypothetical protein
MTTAVRFMVKSEIAALRRNFSASSCFDVN